MAEITTVARSARRTEGVPWLLMAALIVLGIVAVSLLGGQWRALQQTGSDRIVIWFVVMGFMVLFLGLVGRATTNRWLGVLVDSTYRMSLSRLQIALWSVLVLSAYLTIAMPRVLGTLVCEPTDSACEPAPLQITFPTELVLAMGISAASFAGSNLIHSNKKNRVVEVRQAGIAHHERKLKEAQTSVGEADSRLSEARKAADNALLRKQEIEIELAELLQNAQAAVNNASDEDRQEAEADLRAAERLAIARRGAAEKTHQDAVAAVQQAEEAMAQATTAFDKVTLALERSRVEREGLLYRNSDPSKASWSDLFRGSEVGNYMLIDMAKVQMFFFTIIVLVAYGAALAALLRNGDALLHPLGVDLPPFSDSLNTLLAISHGAYLSVKTIDHTQVVS